MDLIFTPNIKGFTPDEEAAVVYDILEAEKADISAVLWEATYENYKSVISVATTSDDGKVRKLGIRTLTITYVMIGFQGPAPVADSMSSPASVSDGRVIIFQKVQWSPAPSR